MHKTSQRIIVAFLAGAVASLAIGPMCAAFLRTVGFPGLIYQRVVMPQPTAFSPTPSPTPSSAIAITTDKLAYQPGEVVQITFRNNAEKDLWVWGGQPYNTLEQWDQGKWVGVDQIGCPCGAFCEAPLHWYRTFPAGVSESRVWNLWESACGDGENRETFIYQPAPAGRYRVAIAYSSTGIPENDPTLQTMAYSPEFTLTSSAFSVPTAVQRSVAQGDFVRDDRSPDDACNTLLPELLGAYGYCHIRTADRVDAGGDGSMLKKQCIDGASIAGCFTCLFTCAGHAVPDPTTAAEAIAIADGMVNQRYRVKDFRAPIATPDTAKGQWTVEYRTGPTSAYSLNVVIINSPREVRLIPYR
ncbi:MAG: hypothetical protein PHI63_01890 [Patescibacteria group bacterium]|nr:hypothetical protein [Patescibacteria group bacterium]